MFYLASTTWINNNHDNLSSLDLGIYEAQNRPPWILMSAQHYALIEGMLLLEVRQRLLFVCY